MAVPFKTQEKIVELATAMSMKIVRILEKSLTLLDIESSTVEEELENGYARCGVILLDSNNPAIFMMSPKDDELGSIKETITCIKFEKNNELASVAAYMHIMMVTFLFLMSMSVCVYNTTERLEDNMMKELSNILFGMFEDQSYNFLRLFPINFNAKSDSGKTLAKHLVDTFVINANHEAIMGKTIHNNADFVLTINTGLIVGKMPAILLVMLSMPYNSLLELGNVFKDVPSNNEGTNENDHFGLDRCFYHAVRTLCNGDAQWQPLPRELWDKDGQSG
jgi:hypothetical protein